MLNNQFSHIEDIAYMASEKLQNLYCIDGDINEYLLPEELLDKIIDLSKRIENKDVFINSQLNYSQKCALERFSIKVVELSPLIPIDDDSLSNEMLISGDQSWGEVREECMKVLECFSFDLKKWESDQLVKRITENNRGQTTF